MKVLVAEKIAEEGIEHLRNNGFEVDVRLGLSHDDLLPIIAEYDGLIVRSATKANAALIAKADNLKVIGRAGVGVDNIDVPECTKRGIIVVNTPDGNTMAAAELAVALVFSIFRNIPQAYAAAKHFNDFRRGKFVGTELDGKVAGVIGMGKIGSIVASKLKGVNMKVIAFDPYVSDEKYKKLGVEKCSSLEELLKQSDLITIHMPKTDETYGMIGEKQFALCKKGVKIVNAARGGLVNEKALYNAIKEGIVSAAGIDVLDPEPNYTKKPEEQDYKNPLLELDNVIALPHLGASTEEANYNVGVQIAYSIADALKGNMVPAVNMPSLKHGSMETLRPYLELGEVLGKIYYQTEKETVQKVEVTFSGEVVNMDTGLITLSVVKGLLEPTVEEKINFVNAPMLLATTGIELVESKSTSHEKYTNLITVKFITKSNTLSVSGTVFAKDEIRLVDFFGYKLNFEPSSHVLAIQNVDKPGIIGQVGTILGVCSVNVAAMQLGRNKKGERAVSFLSVDGIVSEDVLNQLRGIEGIIKVSRIAF